MAATQWGRWYNGAVEGAERFMVEWHQQEEAKRCPRHAKEVARGTRDRRGREGRIDNDSSTAIGERKGEMANRIVRFQADNDNTTGKLELRVYRWHNGIAVASSDLVARRGRRRSGAVHGGVAPTGRGEEVRAPCERGGARHKG